MPARDKLLTIDPEAYRAATEAGTLAHARGHAVAVRYYGFGRRLSVRLASGMALVVPVDRVEGLCGEADAALRDVLLTPGGAGLHFPQLDVDLSVEGLLSGVLGSPAWMEMLAVWGSSLRAMSVNALSEWQEVVTTAARAAEERAMRTRVLEPEAIERTVRDRPATVRRRRALRE